VESKHAEIYSLVDERPTRDREARKLLKLLGERRELPFAARWYGKKISPLRLNLILNQLASGDILKAYPPLHEKKSGVVSQFEHTVIVTEDGCEVTTK
jgi:methionyl aminopeptidase